MSKIDLTPLRAAIKKDLDPSEHALAELACDAAQLLFDNFERLTFAVEMIAAKLPER